MSVIGPIVTKREQGLIGREVPTAEIAGGISLGSVQSVGAILTLTLVVCAPSMRPASFALLIVAETKGSACPHRRSGAWNGGSGRQRASLAVTPEKRKHSHRFGVHLGIFDETLLVCASCRIQRNRADLRARPNLSQPHHPNRGSLRAGRRSERVREPHQRKALGNRQAIGSGRESTRRRWQRRLRRRREIAA